MSKRLIYFFKIFYFECLFRGGVPKLSSHTDSASKYQQVIYYHLHIINLFFILYDESYILILYPQNNILRSVFLMVFNLFEENTHLSIKLYFSIFCQPPQIFLLCGPKQSKQFHWQKLQWSQRVSTNKYRLLGFCLIPQKLCREEGAGQLFHSYEVSRTTGLPSFLDYTWQQTHILCTALFLDSVLNLGCNS